MSCTKMKNFYHCYTLHIIFTIKKKFVSSISFFEIYILWSNSDIKCLIIIAPQWPPEVIWDTLWIFKNNSKNLVIHWTFSQHKTGLRNQKFFTIMSSSHFIQITRLIGLIMKVFYLLNSLDGFSMYRLYNENNIFETGLDMIGVKSVFFCLISFGNTWKNTSDFLNKWMLMAFTSEIFDFFKLYFLF